MAKTRVKIKVQTGRKGDAGTLIARVPIAVVRNAKPRGKPLFQTAAQMNLHIYGANGQPRPTKTQFRRTN